MTPVKPAAVDASSLVPAKKSKNMKLVLFVLGGAVAGYLYYRLVGCRSGTCPITSSPIISSLYGAMMGFLLSRN